MRHRIKRSRAFTLVELLVVVLILSILVTVALPNYLSSLKTANSNLANTNAKVIATAVQANYMRLGANSYLNVITAGGVDATNGMLYSDLGQGGQVPKNPCTGGTSLNDYTMTSAAGSFTIKAKDPNGVCSGLNTFSLNGP